MSGSRDTSEGEEWEDETAEPLIRPYAVAGGRTSRRRFDLVALVHTTAGHTPPRAHRPLHPEHLAVLDLCRGTTCSVAEISARLGLLVGVVQVLLDDLEDADLVTVWNPGDGPEVPMFDVLTQVLEGLHAL
ncbi:MAG: DUF742 domain-containing protein [Micromonosporaceae bacterium]